MHDLALGLRYHHIFAVSVREPAASAVTMVVAVAASASTSASSSELRHDGRTLAHANCNAGVLEVTHPEDPIQSCDICNGREDVAVEYSSGDVERLGEYHRAIAVSEAHYSSGCREDSLHDAPHLCEDLLQEHLILCVERRTVINKSYCCLPAFQKNHLCKPACASGRRSSSIVIRRRATMADINV